MTHKDVKSNLVMALFASLTLGLTPFYPEPHIVGKIRWVLGGAIGMKPMDYFDLILHGIPWLALIYYSYIFIIDKIKQDEYSRHSKRR